jgi:predicted transcriptional regulator
MRITAELVKAYLSTSPTAPVDLPALIRDVRLALSGLEPGDDRAEADAAETAETASEFAQVSNRPSPAVDPAKSITPAYLISLEDGRPYKSLKRHLWLKYRMTPEQYRIRWGLPPDYPMVSPNYANRRAEIARAIGLGLRATTCKPTEARR